MNKEPRVYILCLMHSQKGQLIAATTREFGNDIAAVCPFCIHQLKKDPNPTPNPETISINEGLGTEKLMIGSTKELVDTHLEDKD